MADARRGSYRMRTGRESARQGYSTVIFWCQFATASRQLRDSTVHRPVRYVLIPLADAACGSICEPFADKLLIGRDRPPPPGPDRARGARSPPRRAPPPFLLATARRAFGVDGDPASHQLTACDRQN